MIRRNLIANYLGAIWSALVGLAFIPLYIKYLGIEAYGLIGLFATLQTWLVIVDMGMTPTMVREIARFTGGRGNADTIRDLLRSIELIALAIAMIISIGIWLISDWLATDWLRDVNIPTHEVARAFNIMGAVAALRFIEGIYRSCIMGLQQQALFNLINVGLTTLRALGSVGVLAWISPTIEAFFIWQGIVSIITLIILASTTYKILPYNLRSGKFSTIALKDVGQFAGGVTLISFAGLILTGVDRILLSTLLPLAEYGRYTLAIVVASVVAIFSGPIITTIYPRLCELVEKKDEKKLAVLFHSSAQLVTVLIGSTAIMIAFFSEHLLLLWTRDAQLSSQTAGLLRLLVLVQLISSLMYVPHNLQLAYGWTSLELKIYSVAIVIVVPLTLWTAPRYGAIGCSWILLTLGLGQLIIGVQIMFKKILTHERKKWYLYDLMIPLVTATFVSGTAKAIFPSSSNYIVQGLTLGLTLICATFLSAMAGFYTRQQVMVIIKRFKSQIRRTKFHEQ